MKHEQIVFKRTTTEKAQTGRVSDVLGITDERAEVLTGATRAIIRQARNVQQAIEEVADMERVNGEELDNYERAFVCIMLGRFIEQNDNTHTGDGADIRQELLAKLREMLG